MICEVLLKVDVGQFCPFAVDFDLDLPMDVRIKPAAQIAESTWRSDNDQFIKSFLFTGAIYEIAKMLNEYFLVDFVRAGVPPGVMSRAPSAFELNVGRHGVGMWSRFPAATEMAGMQGLDAQRDHVFHGV